MVGDDEIAVLCVTGYVLLFRCTQRFKTDAHQEITMKLGKKGSTYKMYQVHVKIDRSNGTMKLVPKTPPFSNICNEAIQEFGTSFH